MKKLLAIEAMTLGVKRMADCAAGLGYQLELLAGDPSMYVDSADTPVTRFPTQDKEALASYIAERRKSIGGIFSSTDTWGVAAAELRETFSFPSRITSEKLSRMRDKKWVVDKLAGDAQAADVSYPMIAKPRRGTGKINVRLIESPEDHRRFAASVEEPDAYVFQKYHRGPLYSAEVWSNGKTFVFFGVTNRITTEPPQFLERVKTFPHEHDTPWEQSVKRWCEDLISQLDYDLGLAHVEFIETSEGFQLVEVNPRMAGALITPAIDHCTNYDPYALAVADALDIVPDLPDDRKITGGYCHVSLYADRLGRLEAVEGLETLVQYPGNAGWVPSKDPGMEIPELGTYRARIGNVFASGPSAAIAQDRAVAAASSVRVRLT